MGGGGLVLAGLTPLGLWLIGPLENRYPIPDDPGQIDGVIILGGSELDKLSEACGFPQVNQMGGRHLAGLLLAEKFPRAKVVHSGGGGQVRRDGRTISGESKVAAAILLGAGVAAERLTFEDRSRNTCENAALSKERVKPRLGERWLLVTAAFHMPRAVACFRANDWEVIPHPTDFKRSPELRFDSSLFSFVGNLATLDQATHEWLGLAYYRMRGLIDEM
jgi:uncharacterized SAM-binding protein YcdF (DUF218 family)